MYKMVRSNAEYCAILKANSKRDLQLILKYFNIPITEQNFYEAYQRATASKVEPNEYIEQSEIAEKHCFQMSSYKQVSIDVSTATAKKLALGKVVNITARELQGNDEKLWLHPANYEKEMPSLVSAARQGLKQLTGVGMAGKVAKGSPEAKARMATLRAKRKYGKGI
ncbi:hypothetical protein Poli38472_007189 [Pythium oligandrum]|uniref:Uncharacterized protein n=1 Tax=Pythium oligandrum TaxID=41045 RepID=A0A8K1C9P5_PYTOL|nr:hypothetical protein Poli38472_007189 [Pythium oligandrum]|eukprot:TMW59044.1 hypothetical protein Poli38472_007189 [Pythium oligandrum]